MPDWLAVVLPVVGSAVLTFGAWLAHNVGKLKQVVFGNGDTGLAQRVKELEDAALRQRVDSLEHSVYDPKGTNGLVRRMKALEGETLTADEIKMAARHEARSEVQKVIETLERIYEGKRKREEP